MAVILYMGAKDGSYAGGDVNTIQQPHAPDMALPAFNSGEVSHAKLFVVQ
jgi:hypothetical protein